MFTLHTEQIIQVQVCNSLMLYVVLCVSDKKFIDRMKDNGDEWKININTDFL